MAKIKCHSNFPQLCWSCQQQPLHMWYVSALIEHQDMLLLALDMFSHFHHPHLLLQLTVDDLELEYMSSPPHPSAPTHHQTHRDDYVG
jgi:hypothetical protein